MDQMVIEKLRAAYKDKKVIVTGDTGFKGSWLALCLLELGAEVLGIALPPERDNDHFNAVGLSRLVRHVDCDIRDGSAIQHLFDQFRPDFVFHLAAQALVRTSYDEPKRTFDTNIGGSVNILEAVRATSSVRSLIYVTSDKCYRNQEWIWGYRENDELGGRDPYSASKSAAEIVFYSYLMSYFAENPVLGAASVRAGNVIGGGDWAQDRIVPDCIRALESDQPIILRNPDSTRPWQHVLEPLFGYMRLAVELFEEPKRFSGSWNFGPNDESIHTVGDLAKEIVSLWGKGEVRFDNSRQPHEANLLHLNCDKVRHVLGWKPQWDFLKTVQESVSWYKSVAGNEPALQVSQRQINDYMGASL
ncbi:MAG: CDP-glucose 4,6-dehydratase [Acidobacteriota bacterium]